MERKEKRDRENASVKRMFDIGFSVDLRKKSSVVDIRRF